jgi:mannose-6-phosphate isomerase
VDRADAQSVVAQGPHAGRTLHDLWSAHRTEIFGPDAPATPCFPLLAKILDARETLSVQVHPPARVAAELGGEPKTEMWYLLDATPDAAVYAGFRAGVGRREFEQALADGTVESVLHRIPVQKGDAIFIPSGRCHAIGGGCLIVEIQQNSDTTYRVFDWNRVGLDGKPRPLHLQESLASIDFNDREPTLSRKSHEGVLAECEQFWVAEWELESPRHEAKGSAPLYTVLHGTLAVGEFHFKKGDFFVLPSQAVVRTLTPLGGPVRVLRTTLR